MDRRHELRLALNPKEMVRETRTMAGRMERG